MLSDVAVALRSTLKLTFNEINLISNALSSVILWMQFFQNGTTFSVMDDSTTTAKTNNFVKYDLVGCEGFLNLMEDVLNPCAPDITAAPIFNGTASPPVASPSGETPSEETPSEASPSGASPPPPSVSSSYMLRASAIVGLVVVAAAMLLL